MKRSQRKAIEAMMEQADAAVEEATRAWENADVEAADLTPEVVAELNETAALEAETAPPAAQTTATVDPANPYGYVDGTDPKRYNQLLAAYKRKVHNAMRLCHVAQEPKGLKVEDVDAVNGAYGLPRERAWFPGAKFAPVTEQS